MSRCRIASYQAQTGKVQQDWHHVDAEGQILGRLAVRIATVLMGKHKPTYTAHVDTGDFVVVTNVEKVRLTGNKVNEMVYPRYSYYPSGYSETPYRRVLERHPDRILRESVRRMLPKNALGRKMLAKLKLYAGSEHPHSAQRPKQWAF